MSLPSNYLSKLGPGRCSVLKTESVICLMIQSADQLVHLYFSFGVVAPSTDSSQKLIVQTAQSAYFATHETIKTAFRHTLHTLKLNKTVAAGLQGRVRISKPGTGSPKKKKKNFQETFYPAAKGARWHAFPLKQLEEAVDMKAFTGKVKAHAMLPVLQHP